MEKPRNPLSGLSAFAAPLGLALLLLGGLALAFTVATCHTRPPGSRLPRRARRQAEAAVHGYLARATADSAAAARQLARSSAHLTQARAWVDSATAAHEASLTARPADSLALARYFTTQWHAYIQAKP